MNTKNKFFSLSAVFIFLFSSIQSLFAQLPDYRIYNKTQCSTEVTAYCTDNSSNSAILPSNAYLSGTCPTDETLCYVTMEFPSSAFLLTENGNPGVPLCPNSGEVTPSENCYTQNIQWTIVSTIVICNIY